MWLCMNCPKMTVSHPSLFSFQAGDWTQIFTGAFCRGVQWSSWQVKSPTVHGYFALHTDPGHRVECTGCPSWFALHLEISWGWAKALDITGCWVHVSRLSHWQWCTIYIAIESLSHIVMLTVLLTVLLTELRNALMTSDVRTPWSIWFSWEASNIHSKAFFVARSMELRLVKMSNVRLEWFSYQLS